jgi:predicted deacylase
MQRIIINKKEFLPGQSGEHILNTYYLPSRTPIDVPVFVMRSMNPGPVVLFQAGVHGDEVNGIETLRNLLAMDEVRNPLSGTIIIIPIVNVISFLLSSRDLPDEKDLNRCFPGSKNGSMGSRIAYDLMKEIVPQIDFGIDFHTGGAKINNYPQIRCAFDNEANLDIAKMFGAPFTINSPFREKSLRREAARRGKSILVYEGGESMRFNKQAINEGVQGCLRLLSAKGMIPSIAEPSESVFITDTKWARAKTSGLFRTSKKYGTYIEKGEIIGIVSDPYLNNQNPIVSNVDGFLIGINNQPVVHEGDALLHIGVE